MDVSLERTSRLMSQKLWRKYPKTHKAWHAHTKVKICFQNLVQLRLKNKNVLVPINNFQPKTWKLLPNIYLLLSPCWAKLWVDFALDFVKHKAVTLIPLNMKKNIVNYGTRISIIFQNWFYNDFVLLNKYMDDKDLLHIRSYNPFSLSQYFLFFFFFKCDALRNLVPFAQFKKCEKQPWRSVTFS